MSCRRQQDQDVKDLMRAPKHVEFPGVESLGYACLAIMLAIDPVAVGREQGLIFTHGIDTSTQYIQESL